MLYAMHISHISPWAESLTSAPPPSWILSVLNKRRHLSSDDRPPMINMGYKGQVSRLLSTFLEDTSLQMIG
jgi:hypothetical protein